MSDGFRESQLAIRRADGSSTLMGSTGHSGLVVRGRRDAGLLTYLVSAESEEERSGLFDPDSLWYGLHSKSREEVQSGAERGDVRDQNVLGLLYTFGAGRDLLESSRWYRKAAAQGYAPAEFNLGWMYDNPYLSVPGVGQDYTQAAHWYRKAGNQGFPPAQFNLGVMYERGEGVAQDFAEACQWYRKAAEQGLAHAQFNLSLKYERGQGLPRDSLKASSWCREAAELEFAKAQFNLGLKFATGQGVPQDLVLAYMWMHLAAPRSNDEGRQRYTATLNKLATNMNAAQVQEARSVALSWEKQRRRP